MTTHAEYRELIADLLGFKYEITKNVSVSLSQGQNWDLFNVTGAKGRRKYARAILAIRSLILGQGPAQAGAGVLGVNQATLQNALGVALGAAYKP